MVAMVRVMRGQGLLAYDSGGSKDPEPRCRGRLIAMLVLVNTNENNTERTSKIFYS